MHKCIYSSRKHTLTHICKIVFGFDQKQLETVGAIGNIGQYFGIAAGYFADRYGPKINLTIAMACAVAGHGLVYLMVAGYVRHSSIWGLSAAYGIALQSQCWIDTVLLLTNIHNFPQQPALIMGLDKAFNGLGAGVFSQIYSGFFEPSVITNATSPVPSREPLVMTLVRLS